MFMLILFSVSVFSNNRDAENNNQSLFIQIGPNPVLKSRGYVNFSFKTNVGNVETTLIIYDNTSNIIYENTEYVSVPNSRSINDLVPWNFASIQNRTVTSTTYLAILRVKNIETGQTEVVRDYIGIKGDD